MTRRVVSCGLLGRRTCLCVRLNDGTCVKAKRLTRWIWTEAAVCGLTVMKVKHCRWHRSGRFKRTTSCGSLTNALRWRRLTTGARIRERKGMASLNKPNVCHRRFTARQREEKKKKLRVQGSSGERNTLMMLKASTLLHVFPFWPKLLHTSYFRIKLLPTFSFYTSFF